MPKYRITSPDGKTFEITAPEGTTQQQVMDYARKQFAQISAPADAPNPTDGMSTTQKVLAGIGMGMDDIYMGAKQRLGLASQQEINDKLEIDRALRDTTAGTVGNITGKIALALPAAFVPGANTVAGAAALGAGQGALEPTGENDSVLKNMAIGGLGGAGGVVAGRLIKSGYQGLRALIEPFTGSGQQRIAGRVLERFSENPQALRSVSSAPTMTGALPTLSEAARDRGIATLERAIGQQDPQVASRFLQRASDNNAARVNVLKTLAGSPAQRVAAEAARDAGGGQMYRAATSANYTVDKELSDLLSRPAVRQAMERAKNLAENEGRQFSFTTTPQNSYSGLGVPTNTSRQVTGQGLQDLKMAMDEMLTDPTSGFTGKAGDAVRGLKGKIVDWMERANPDFRTARQSYAELSKPLNQMDVGERLLQKAGPAIRDMGGNKRLTANAFSRLMDDEQNLVRQATGFKGVNALEDVLTPQQLASLGAVRNELELASNLASAANGPGAQTAKSLASENLLRQLIGPTGMPESWADSAILQTLARPVQFGMKAAEPKIQQTLADILLDPSLARAALDSAAPRSLPNTLQGVLRLGQTAAQQSVPAGLISMSR
jgi:hypothetical protein